MTRRNREVLFLAIVVGVVSLDQATKLWIESHLAIHDSVAIIPGCFHLTYVRNPGAAFGFLAGAPPLFRSLFFLGISLFAIALILYYLRHYPERHPLFTVSLAGICAGALGNMIDRVRLGEVIDFFDVFIGRAHWPAFNVADSAITIGAACLFTPSCGMAKKNRPEVNPRPVEDSVRLRVLTWASPPLPRYR